MGEVEGVGWLSVPWGERNKKREGQLHLAHPSGTVLPHKKSLEIVGDVDVDYKGGVSFRRS